jgi:hypothetical protein
MVGKNLIKAVGTYTGEVFRTIIVEPQISGSGTPYTVEIPEYWLITP